MPNPKSDAVEPESDATRAHAARAKSAKPPAPKRAAKPKAKSVKRPRKK